MRNDALPPAGLPPAGLNRVTDNVPAGQRLHVPGGAIWMFFEEELRERFLQPGEAGATGDTGEAGGGDAATSAEPARPE